MATRQQAIAALQSLVQANQPQINIEGGGRSLTISTPEGRQRKIALREALANERGVQAR